MMNFDFGMHATGFISRIDLASNEDYEEMRAHCVSSGSLRSSDYDLMRLLVRLVTRNKTKKCHVVFRCGSSACESIVCLIGHGCG